MACFERYYLLKGCVACRVDSGLRCRWQRHGRSCFVMVVCSAVDAARALLSVLLGAVPVAAILILVLVGLAKLCGLLGYDARRFRR